MRFLLAALLLVAVARGAVPAELAAALKDFRPDPPPGWSFVQTTAAEGKSQTERSDATKPSFDRWSLVLQNGRAPTPEETANYGAMRSRRSRGGTAPKITDQLDLSTVEVVTETPAQVTYRCRLKPAEAGDKTAAFLRATIVVDRPTHTLLSIALASTGEFSPTLGVKISELKTELTYTPPVGDRPGLPAKVETRVRGRAFYLKSLDADMTVTFSGYERATKK